MKRTSIIISSIFALVATFSSCQKSESPVPAYEAVELIAEIEQMPSTKTVMDQNRNVLWLENDMIVAFLKSSLGLQYKIAEESVGKTSARFTRVETSQSDDIYVGTQLDHNIIFYPYQENVESVMIDDGYTMSVSLPAEQNYQKGSFGNGAFPMVSISQDNNFTFLNTCGGIRFQLRGSMKVASVTVTGNNQEGLSGEATVTAFIDGTPPSLVMAEDAGTEVTLDCGSGINLKSGEDTDFIIALPPIPLESGFTVKIVDNYGRIYTLTSSAPCEIRRSALMVMPSVEIPSFTDSDYNDEYGINHGEGIDINGVIWAPVNCGYRAATESDRGYPYGKLYQWGRKDGQGYDNSSYIGMEEFPDTKIYQDATTPDVKEESILLSEVDKYPNTYFINDGDWLPEPVNNLWNTGSEALPSRTQYDPCPYGWRVPTESEMESLIVNKECDEENGGFWFKDSSSDAKIFFPAAGSIGYGIPSYRGLLGYYWTSTPSENGSTTSTSLDFIAVEDGADVELSSSYRQMGMSVRCVRNN